MTGDVGVPGGAPGGDGGRDTDAGSLPPLVLREARVVDPSAPHAAGRPVDVRLERGLVAAVGPGAAVRPGDAVVELGGRWLAPGLWDAHVHVGQWALARQRLDVSGAASAAEVADAVTARLRARPGPAGAPLVVFGYRDVLWPDRPRVALLDAAAAAAGEPSAPVVAICGDLHSAWLSSAALRRFGVGRHDDGVLREEAWFGLQGRVDDVSSEVLDAWVADGLAEAARRGVVGVVDYELADNRATWRRRAADGPLGVRVVAAVWREHLDAVIAAEAATGETVPGTGGLVTQGPLKVISDGSLTTRTAYCFEPYAGLAGPDAHGVLNVEPDALVPLMAHATRHGLGCAIHAIGDRANALALDAFAATGASGSIEHAQLLRDEDVARFAALGVVASVQPEHAMDDRDVADRLWGPRTARAFPLRRLHEAGVRLVLGSDAPVAALDPWQAISAAVHRTRDGRAPWHPEQAIEVRVALAASVRSRVAVGMPADLAVLDADPFTAGVRTLREMPVAATLLGGRWTHREV